MTESAGHRAGTRAAIVDAAAELLREGGSAAVTTRGVAERAGVQAPAIYRLFGDKDGLLEAVAEHVMATFVSDKSTAQEAAAAAEVDPEQDLRQSWHRQIEFGLANPALFRLLSDPDRVRSSAAAERGQAVLSARVHRLAVAGRLQVSEARAAELIQAAGVGTISSLLATPAEHRDLGLGDAMLDLVLGAILDGPPSDSSSGRPGTPDTTIAAAVTLRAHASELEPLSESERRLLVEWLDRITSGSGRPGSPV